MNIKFEDLESLLIDKAMADKKFKDELISNPKLVISKEIGKELPNDIEIVIIESTTQKLYLVLPPKLESGEILNDELSDDELNTVAGGFLSGEINFSSGEIIVSSIDNKKLYSAGSSTHSRSCIDSIRLHQF